MFRNTLAQALRLLTAQGFSFLLAPIMVDRLGLTLFGVWTIVGAIVAYASILDAGITRALARFIALYETAGEERRIRETVGLGLLCFTVLGLLLIPLAWFTAPLATDLIGHISTHDMRQILLASAVIFLLQGYTSVIQALPHGLRRMVPPNVAAVVSNTVNFAASVGSLLITSSLVTYAWANAAAVAVGLVLMYGGVRFVWNKRMVAWPGRAVRREILGYSVASQLGWIADLVNLQTDKIIVGLIVGPRAAGIYQIGASVAIAIREIGVITVSAMIPTATAEIATNGKAAVRRLFTHYLPRTLGIAFPMFALGALTAPFLIRAWIGDGTGQAVGVLIALCAAYAVNIVTGVPSTVALADGRPGFVSRNSLWMAVLNVVLTLALAPAFGLGGVVAGTVVAVSALSAVLVIKFARSYEIGAGDVWRSILPSAAATVAVGLPFVPGVFATASLATSRLSATALLAAFGLGYLVVYWPIASRAGVLPERIALRRRRPQPVAGTE